MLELPEHLHCFYQKEFYPHPVKHIEMIQTHISWVFLTGSFAYKIKKPVDFGFLDFSSLAQRKYYCERELELNRRFSPAIYLDVLAIHNTGDSCNLNKSGKVIEYCLKMQQFRQSDLFDYRLTNNLFNPAWLDQLASKTALFHHQQEAVSNSRIDHALLLDKHIQANLNVAEKYIGRAVTYNTVEQLSDYAEQASQKFFKSLSNRQSDGFVRRCHGDLHLKNITLFNYEPHLFDCIEFNDEFSIIDTMNDIAFLIMDLDAHHHPELAMRFLSRYLEYSGDYSGLILLHYYLYYRACVRGKVACLLAAELDMNEQESPLNEAKQYFELAATYTKPASAKLFAIGGLSGGGKSHLALLGCGIEQAIIIRSDATRKRIAADYPDLELYSTEMHINTYQAMFDAARITLNAGLSVILDATFLHPGSRQQLKTLADECSTALHCFWLDIEEEQLKKNIRSRDKAANDISDADLHVLELQLGEYQRPTEPWIQFLNSSDSWPRS